MEQQLPPDLPDYLPGICVYSQTAKRVSNIRHTVHFTVLREAGQIQASSGSTVQFRWMFRRQIVEDLELWFVSSKNPRLLLRRVRGHMITVDDPASRAGLQVEDVIDHVVIFTLQNVSRADMGVYMLHVPQLGIYDLPSVIFVSGKPVVSGIFHNIS